jgi:hypothetical protein
VGLFRNTNINSMAQKKNIIHHKNEFSTTSENELEVSIVNRNNMKTQLKY